MIFLIFEGLPGSGKTTLTNHLENKFEFCKRVGEVIDKKGHEIYSAQTIFSNNKIWS